MKKILASLSALFVLATAATAFAYYCDGDTCTLPEKEYKVSAYDDGYCYNADRPSRRGSCCNR